VQETGTETVVNPSSFSTIRYKEMYKHTRAELLLLLIKLVLQRLQRNVPTGTFLNKRLGLCYDENSIACTLIIKNSGNSDGQIL